MKKKTSRENEIGWDMEPKLENVEIEWLEPLPFEIVESAWEEESEENRLQ